MTDEANLTAAERAVRAAQDPVVAEIQAAPDEEARIAIERQHVVETDKSLRPGDPEEQPE